MTLRLLSRLAAAVVLTAAAGAVVPSAPASAAACSSADGVTVVVDFHELGGGVQQVCDAGGAGHSAGDQFAESGFTLTRVQRQPGFVCRVNGAPSQDPCVNTPPADAYWGVWWSNGTSGTWTYASQGVDSLEVPAGGYVALSWNDSATKSPPGATPSPHPADPIPSPSATPHPTPSGGGSHPSASPSSPAGPGQAATSGGVTPSASGSPTSSDGASGAPRSDKKQPGKQSGKKKHSGVGPSATPGSTQDPDASASASPTGADAADPTDPQGGLPGWVAPAGIALLFVAAAGTAAVRRRRGPASP